MTETTSHHSSILRIGAWRVDPALCEISKDGNTLKLEPREMQLLLYLAARPGRVVSVEQLLEHVWSGGGGDLELRLPSGCVPPAPARR
jgi:DNA-binding response OmpR family regulator